MFRKTSVKKMKKHFNQLSLDIYKKYGLRFDLQMNDYNYCQFYREIYVLYTFTDFSTMKYQSGMILFFKSKKDKKWKFDDDFYKNLVNFIKKCYELKKE